MALPSGPRVSSAAPARAGGRPAGSALPRKPAMWTNALDLLVQRFPGSSALAASTILGEAPTCVAVHAHVLCLVEEYADDLPLADRLHRAVPGPETDLTVLVRIEPLLARLGRLLEEIAGGPVPHGDRPVASPPC